MLRFKNTTDDSPKGMYISPFAEGKNPGGDLANLWFTLRNIADITPNQKDIRTSSDINKLGAIPQNEKESQKPTGDKLSRSKED